MTSYLNEIQVSYTRTTIPVPAQPITSSSVCYTLLKTVWKGSLDYVESLYVVILSWANQVISYYQLSVGGRAGTVCDMVVLFQVLLKTNAHGFILAHNHPGGSLRPSQKDYALTAKVKKLSHLFEICFLDHLILTQKNYYSFADNGEMSVSEELLDQD